MSKKDKLIERLKSVPRDFTFDEMQSLLEILGFEMSNKGRTSGSRVKFEKDGFPIIMHKPHPRKELHVGSVKNVLEILEEKGLI